MPIIEIFTSPTCIYCPKAKEIVAEIAKEKPDVTVVEHSAATEEGRKRAQEFNIASVPTIFISGPKTKEILAFSGVPSKEKLIEAIYVVG